MDTPEDQDQEKPKLDDVIAAKQWLARLEKYYQMNGLPIPEFSVESDEVIQAYASGKTPHEFFLELTAKGE